MASQVFNGTGPVNTTTKFTYTNNTGQNVRVRIMNIESANALTISGSGVVNSTVNFSIPTTTPRDYVLSSGQILTITGSTANFVPYNIIVIPEGG